MKKKPYWISRPLRLYDDNIHRFTSDANNYLVNLRTRSRSKNQLLCLCLEDVGAYWTINKKGTYRLEATTEEGQYEVRIHKERKELLVVIDGFGYPLAELVNALLEAGFLRGQPLYLNLYIE